MRKVFRGYLFSFCLLAALLIGLHGTGVAFARTYSQHVSSHQATSSGCSGWSVVSSADALSGYPNYLSSVAAVSSSDVWAVGYYITGHRDINATLIEHWDGTSWRVITSPNIGTSSNYLNGVAVVSANDVWAVGGYNKAGSVYGTLIEHWDGTSWSVVHSPNVSSYSNNLSSVVAVSANDVWAVGSASEQTLIEQWNGTSWSIVSSPNAGSNSNFLSGVAAVSATDVWTVGMYSNDGSIYKTLIEQWNGTSWSIIPSPNANKSNNELNAVAVVSTSDVWAVGFSDFAHTMTEQWNGTKWSIISSPNASSKFNAIQGVAAISATDVWIVGYYPPGGSKPSQTLIENYC